MKAPLHSIYLDPDDMDSRAQFAKEGIARSASALRADAVLIEAKKRMALPFDDRTYSSVRGYISRLRLSPSRLMRLVLDLGMRAANLAWNDGDPVARGVAFHSYRAALSLLVEVTPRSHADWHDLLPVLMTWPGALPPSIQARVAASACAYMADTITGRPFKRRALLPRGGARRS